MKYLFFLLFLLSATGLSAQVPEEDTGDYSRQPPLLNNFKSYRQQQNWTTIEGFRVGNKGYAMYLRARGVDASGYNVRIRPVRTDGSLGPAVRSYKWSEGWTSATFYPVQGKLYLMLAKKQGVSSSGNNVHVHRMNTDGTVGPLVNRYKWSEGWTNFTYYNIGTRRFMLQAKKAGYGDSGNNVHVRRVNTDGSLGGTIASYRWTEGWDTFERFRLGNNKQFLLQAKSRGYGGSGNNVHIRRINADGTIGTKAASYRWSEGWTSMTPYIDGGVCYLLQLKKNPTGPNAAAKIRKVRLDGTLTSQVKTFNVSAGWSSVSSFRAYQKGFLLWGRSRGYGPGGNQNVRVYTVR